tara:strand:+ start:353 stop:505 length:153 start_codon:yes stop_codon:yes gene_type:complete
MGWLFLYLIFLPLGAQKLSGREQGLLIHIGMGLKATDKRAQPARAGSTKI